MNRLLSLTLLAALCSGCVHTTFGGDVPEDLLPVPLGVYVDWLFSPDGTPLPLPKAEPERVTKPAYTGRGVEK